MVLESQNLQMLLLSNKATSCCTKITTVATTRTLYIIHSVSFIVCDNGDITLRNSGVYDPTSYFMSVSGYVAMCVNHSYAPVCRDATFSESVIYSTCYTIDMPCKDIE